MQNQLVNIKNEKFNGINLFSTSASDLTVYSTELGKGTITTAAVTGVTAVVAEAPVDTITIGGAASDAGSTVSMVIGTNTYTITEGVDFTAADAATPSRRLRRHPPARNRLKLNAASGGANKA